MSSRFFLRQEHQRGAVGWISAIRRPDGSLATDLPSICDSWVRFYSDLFTAERVDTSTQDSLLGCLSAKLPGDASSSCDGPLSVDEVSLALEGMALEKSPGSDGLPVEFYRAFWHILGADLVDVLNDSLQKEVDRPTRFLQFVAFVDLPFSFRSLDLFVASLLFRKGTSFCVIRRK